MSKPVPTSTTLYVPAAEMRREQERARGYTSWDLTLRQQVDVELLLNGAYAPLTGFLCRDDYASVIERMRLADGTLWPMPVTLELPAEFAAALQPGQPLALRDAEGLLVAVLDIAEIWRPDTRRENFALYGAARPAGADIEPRPQGDGVAYVGGPLRGIEAPPHYDFTALRHSPAELRDQFRRWGWYSILAYPTDTPMHRAQREQTLHAARRLNAKLLIRPVVRPAHAADAGHYARLRCFQHVLCHFPAQAAALSLTPWPQRISSPRDGLWMALLQQNYGCSHILLSDATPQTCDLIERHRDELAIEPVLERQWVYVAERGAHRPAHAVAPGEGALTLSQDELYQRLGEGREIPAWFSYPEVLAELRKIHPPREQQGFTVFFTGLSGAGKSTIANALLVKLLALGGRPVTLLDGDVVRKHLSSELGFSRAHRDLNITRIGFVAAEITKNGGVAICAPIAPYAATRAAVRDMVSRHGGFVEVYVATPLEVCESRDRKGLYARARAGLIKEFTGVSDPYEPPQQPDLAIDTRHCTADEAAQRVIAALVGWGYIK